MQLPSQKSASVSVNTVKIDSDVTATLIPGAGTTLAISLLVDASQNKDGVTTSGYLLVNGGGTVAINSAVPKGAINYDVKAGTLKLSSANATVGANGIVIIETNGILDLVENSAPSASLPSGALTALAGSVIKLAPGVFDKEITLG